MSYWDTSALCPLLRHEAESARVVPLFASDKSPFASWIALVEVRATIARWRREGLLSPDELREALTIWDDARRRISIRQPDGDILRASTALVDLHPLRGMDAIHLGSWRVIATALDAPLPIVSLDRDLRAAALAEGATVLP